MNAWITMEDVITAVRTLLDHMNAVVGQDTSCLITNTHV